MQFLKALPIYILITFLFPLALFSQVGIDNAERPTTKATLITEKPIIDGEVLTDPLWLKVNTVGPLSQNQPNWGEPASEKTDIRIAYDATCQFRRNRCFPIYFGYL